MTMTMTRRKFLNCVVALCIVLLVSSFAEGWQISERDAAEAQRRDREAKQQRAEQEAKLREALELVEAERLTRPDLHAIASRAHELMLAVGETASYLVDSGLLFFDIDDRQARASYYEALHVLPHEIEQLFTNVSVHWGGRQRAWGETVLPSEVANSVPQIDYSCWLEQDLYSVFLLDVDSPSRSAPDHRNLVLWAVYNVPCSDMASGQVNIPYRMPLPLKGSGRHRLMFVVVPQGGQRWSLLEESVPAEEQRSEIRVQLWLEHMRKGFRFPQDRLPPSGIFLLQTYWDESVDEHVQTSERQWRQFMKTFDEQLKSEQDATDNWESVPQRSRWANVAASDSDQTDGDDHQTVDSIIH
jgi:Phosphatidylethanolamine-binding protein